MNTSKLPPHIIDKLKKKGYFNLSDEERIESNKKCFGALLRSSKGDPRAEKAALRDLRGDIGE
jgi:hypothetical protein